MLKIAFAAIAVVVGNGSPAAAQRELRVKKIPEATFAFVATFPAPPARTIAVNDVAGVVAVGMRPTAAGQPLPSGQLAFYRLDAQGQIVPSDPTIVPLPKSAALGDRPNWVIGLVSHPSLPLIYVWQDVPAPPDPMVIEPAQSADFDHLLVFDVSATPPKQVFAAARGTDFHCGAIGGGFAIDSGAHRLYVPNMQKLDAMKKYAPAVGWLRLAPDGLPEFIDPSLKTEDVTAQSVGKKPTAPLLAPPAAAASQAQRTAQWEQSKAAGKPLALSRYAESTTYTFAGWPCPDSYAPVSDDFVMASGHSGAVSWDLNDPSGKFGYFFLTPYIPYRYRVSVHPTMPSAYVVVVTYDGRIVRLEHADGGITLTPQTLTLDNFVCNCRPIVHGKSNRLMVGGNGSVCSVLLTPEGKLTDQVQKMIVPNATVEAIAWSDRFERLYVPVEKTP